MENDLLALTQAAHGTSQLQKYNKLTANMSFGGMIWQGDPRVDALRNSVFEHTLRDGRVTITPFLGTGTRSMFHLHSATIENAASGFLETRYNPAVAPHKPSDIRTWDDFQLAYILSYSFRLCIASPLVFSNYGYQAEELSPVKTPIGQLRRLRVTFPDRDGFHPGIHISYIGADGLIHRQDYPVDMKGELPVSCYIGGYLDVSGVLLPTSRRLYPYQAEWNDGGGPHIFSTEMISAVLE